MNWWPRIFGSFGGDGIVVSADRFPWLGEGAKTKRAAGISITDYRVSLVVVAPSDSTKGYQIAYHGSFDFLGGEVEHGIIQTHEAIAKQLHVLCSCADVTEARVSFPAEAASFFMMHIPGSISSDQVRTMIVYEMEMRVPTRSFDGMIIDYQVIEDRGDEGKEIGVTVYPQELLQGYQEVCDRAGIKMLSLEPSSTASALSLVHPDDPVTMMIDMGLRAAYVTLLKRGIPVQASTIPFNGDMNIRKVDDLAAEIAQRFHHWTNRKNAHGEPVTPIERIIVTGSHAHEPVFTQFADTVSGKTGVTTVYGNVWRHFFSFDDYIPPIERHESGKYASAAGLALRELLENKTP